MPRPLQPMRRREIEEERIEAGDEKRCAEESCCAEEGGGRKRAGDARVIARSKSAPVRNRRKSSTLMSGPKGATLNELVEATDWLPHTTRAALTGLRKRGLSLERVKDEGRGSVYRIKEDRTAAKAA